MKNKICICLVFQLFFIYHKNYAQEKNTSPQFSYLPSKILLNDFIVNDDGSSHYQSNPGITIGGNDHFYIVWDDDRNGYTDIFCQAYNNNGNPLGGNFKVNETHSVHHQFPDLASDSLGNLIIAWADARDGTTYIYGQYYQNNGSASGSNFKVSIDTGQNSSGNTSVAMNTRGDFIIVWENNYQNAKHIYGQRYHNYTVPDGDNFQVNDNTVSNHIFPDVAMDDNSNVVVVWEEEREGQYDIYAQRFNANGNPLWGNFKVNDETNSTNQMHPAIGMDAEGNFVITWNDWRDSAINIYCQQFDHNGVKINSNFRVNDDAGANGITYPDIAMAENGTFAVAWPHNITGIYCQLFDSSGNKSGTNFRINSGNENTRQLLPCVAISDNRLFSSWKDNRLEVQWDIFANILDLNISVPDTVATPAFDPLPGIYTDSVSVSLSCPTPGASIYFTTDESEPTNMNSLYTSPTLLNTTTTLKAKAYKEGLIPSDILTGTYTIEQSYPASLDSPSTIIQLHQGWNLFSFDVEPADLHVSEVLLGIAGDFDVVVGYENGIEKTYDPDSSETSALQVFNPLQGYYIHMLNPAILYISGSEISAATPITLTKGTHLISYLPDDVLPVEEALQSITDHVIYVRSIDQNGILNGQGANGGLSYDPALPEYSTLSAMKNGFGYWIQVDTTVTLTYPEDSDKTLLASTILGPGGGTLSTDEFILTIPQGAFSSDVELTLYESPRSLTYHKNANTTIFALAGLPDDFALPLRLCIKVTGNLSDEHFIAKGEEVFIPDLMDYEYLPFFYETSDSAGFLVTTLPAGDSGSGASITRSLSKTSKGKSLLKKFYGAFGNAVHKTKYFTIVYPDKNNYKSLIPEIGKYFDDAVKSGFGIDLKFDANQLSILGTKALQIFIIENNISNLDYCLITLPYTVKLLTAANLPQHWYRCALYLNENAFVEGENIIRQKTGILVLGILQWMRFNDQSKWSWMNYTYELWLAERMGVTSIGYDPFSLSSLGKMYDLEKQPFLGLEAGSHPPSGQYTNPYLRIAIKKRHGHGMVSFLKLLENVTDLNVVKGIWANLNSQNVVDIIMNVFQNAQIPENQWWPGYFKKYLEGNFYNISTLTLLKTIKNENIFFINEASDMVKDFDRTYPDFSAELFRVDLNYNQIDSLVFTLGPSTLNLDYQTFYVYGLKNNTLHYFSHGGQSEQNIKLTITDIPTLMQSGYTSLVALVVNSANESPYTGSVNIEFEVSQPKVKRQCWITFDNFTYDGTLVDPYGTSSTSGPLEYTMYEPAIGEFSENVYEATWDNKDDSWSTGGSEGYMRIEFNFNNQIITLFHFEVVSKKGDISTKELTLDAVDIPYKGKDPYLMNWDLYKIVGEAIKTDNITKLTYVQKDHMYTGDWVTTLTDYHTQSNSYIYVYMK